MPRLNPRLFFYLAALATLSLYWSGLKGPFVFDDAYNLDPLKNWLAGQASPLEVIFGNQSGVLGRPVSMATFWLSAASGGYHPYPFKLGNLLIHIICGALAWQVTRRMLSRDPRLARNADFIAIAVATIWLIHPINVSTVLYAVQRMAQLSSLFTLAALWVYLSGRSKLENGKVRAALARLFIGFPAFLLLGIFSKENAVVAPALCLVLELAYFRTPCKHKNAIAAFYSLFLLMPAVAVCALAVSSPHHFLSGFEARSFTLMERLLSQPRALIEYIGLILWPRGGLMGLYVDDFQTSRGLWSPPSTLFALIALAAISSTAAALRRRAPTFFAGWFFYLVAHGVESTVLPLELYFEHRNYLPSIGLIIATAGLIDLFPESLQSGSRNLGRGILTAMPLVFVGLAWVTWTQVNVWRSEEAMVDQALIYHPKSARANIVKAGLLLNSGKLDQARRLTIRVAEDPNQHARLQGYISTIIVDCWSTTPPKATQLDQGVSSFRAPIQLSDALSFRQLLDVISTNRCGAEITNMRIADAATKVLAASPAQSESSKAKWMLRTMAATANIRGGQWQQAQDQAEIAWGPGADPAVGGLLTRIYIHNGHKEKARKTLAEVRARVKSFENIGQREMDELQAKIDQMAADEATPARDS